MATLKRRTFAAAVLTAAAVCLGGCATDSGGLPTPSQGPLDLRSQEDVYLEQIEDRERQERRDELERSIFEGTN